MADEGNTGTVDWFEELFASDPGLGLPDEANGGHPFGMASATSRDPPTDALLRRAPLSPPPQSTAMRMIPLHPPAPSAAALPFAHSPAWETEERRGDIGYPFQIPPSVQSDEGGWRAPPPSAYGLPLREAARPNQLVGSGVALADHTGRGLQAGEGGTEGYRYGEIAQLLEWQHTQRPPGTSGMAEESAWQQGSYMHGTQGLHFQDPPYPSAALPAADVLDWGQSPSRPLPPPPSPQTRASGAERPGTGALGSPSAAQDLAEQSLTGGSALHQMSHLRRASGAASRGAAARGFKPSRAASTPPRPAIVQMPLPASRSPALILREALSVGEAGSEAHARSKRARVEPTAEAEPSELPPRGGRGEVVCQGGDLEEREADGGGEGLAGVEGWAASARMGGSSLPSSRLGSEGSAGLEAPLPHSAMSRVPQADFLHNGLEAKEAMEWQAKRDHFGSLMTLNLLRLATCPEAHGGVSHSSMDATTASLRTEQTSLRVAKQATLLRIQQMQQLLQVQEEAEMSVRRLLVTLDQQRASHRQGGLDSDLKDVLRVVQHLNAICRTGPLGPNHHFTSSYASRCCALPFLSRREQEAGITWLSKKDLSGQHSIMERAFAFANGDQAAGEVVMRLTKPADRHSCLALKDIPRLKAQSYHRYSMALFTTIAELTEKLEVVEAGPARQELEAQLNLVCTEHQTADHVYFVAHPLYYKRQEHWLLSEDLSFSEGRGAALGRAVESLRRTGADLQSMRGIWEDRRTRLEPLKQETKRVRRRIGGLFAELSAKPSEDSVDYSDLMEAVAELNRFVDDAHVLLSVAITASNMCVLTSYQMASAIKAAYPHIICYEQLLPILDIPMEEDSPGFLDSKAVSLGA